MLHFTKTVNAIFDRPSFLVCDNIKWKVAENGLLQKRKVYSVLLDQVRIAKKVQNF